MTVMKSGISWTDGTLNVWVGCKKISRACQNCYAEMTVNRIFRNQFDRPFDQYAPKLHRISDIRKFRPKKDKETGRLKPKMLFMNSLSDMWFEDVPEDHRNQVFDAIEQEPDIIFQILTKRSGPARKFLVDRYGNGRGIPRNIWIGPTVEDNRVAKGLNIFRDIKESVGSMTLMCSTEPITAPTDQLDYTGFDWVITGGESGPGAEKMERQWLETALESAIKAGAAVYHKQHGTPASHPNLDMAPTNIRSLKKKIDHLATIGWEFHPHEKGGATIDQLSFRDFPNFREELTARLNGQAAMF